MNASQPWPCHGACAMALPAWIWESSAWRGRMRLPALWGVGAAPQNISLSARNLPWCAGGAHTPQPPTGSGSQSGEASRLQLCVGDTQMYSMSLRLVVSSSCVVLVPAAAFPVQITKHFTSGHNFSCSVARTAAALATRPQKDLPGPRL